MIISKKQLDTITKKAYTDGYSDRNSEIEAYERALQLIMNTTDALIDEDKFVLLATGTNGKEHVSIPVPAQYNRYQDALSAAKRLKLDDKGISYKIVQNVKHKENEDGSEN